MKLKEVKQVKTKSITTFWISKEEGKLKWKTLTVDFAVYKLIIVLSITKLHTHDITFPDICNFLVTGILIR